MTQKIIPFIMLFLATFTYAQSVEICNDGIDNDNDGYIDSFDTDCSAVPACTVASAVDNFAIVKKRFTSGNNAAALTPVVGDLDNDGRTEIIVAELGSPWPSGVRSKGYRIYKGDGSDFNDSTIDIPLLTALGTRDAPIVIPAIADVNKDGKAEIIIVGDDNKVHVYNYSSVTNLTTQTMVSVDDAARLASPKVADINEDGIPEVIIGNSIFTFNAGFTALIRIRAEDATLSEGKAGFAWDMDPVIMDILPSVPGKEFIAGSRVYSLNMATGVLNLEKDLFAISPTIPVGEDGRTAVADMDLDGDLDVVYTSITAIGPLANVNVYVNIWDPNQNVLLMRKAINTQQRNRIGVPFIANVYNDLKVGRPKNLPELVFITGGVVPSGIPGGYVYAFNLYDTVNPLWSFAHQDPSGSTTLNAFDFNGDGVVEMVYRDEANLRIMNGNVIPPVDLSTFPSGSETWVESSVIADVDDDGEAEMVIVSSPNAAGSRDNGPLEVFESDDLTTWVGARNVWNQRGYHVTNINDDLTVPIKEQNSLLQFPAGSGNQPLNSYLAQVTPNPHIVPGFVAVPDLVIGASIFDTESIAGTNCPNYKMTNTISNFGSTAISAPIYFNIYNSDPTVAGAVLLTQLSKTVIIPAGGSQDVVQSFTLPISAYPISTVYVVANTNPNMTVPVDVTDFAASYPECNYTNNFSVLTLPGCKDNDTDGLLDFMDLDDDNDGILDAVESSSCFYALGEANAISKIASRLTSPQDNQADGDIQILHDGTSTSATPNFTFNAGQATVGVEYFRVTYPTPVKLSSLTIANNTTFGAGTTAKLQASNDGNLWTDVGASISLDTTANKVFSSTATSKYFYYRILATNTSAASTIATTTIFEITSIIAADYKSSANPKSACTEANPDGDNIPAYQDLESDGDLCYDAIEGDENVAAAQLKTNGSINTTVDAEGVPVLVNSGGVADIGSDQGQGLGSSQDKSENACRPYCYKAPATGGTVLSAQHGITALNRASSNKESWPTVRKGAWTVLEAKTKGFVINRISATANLKLIVSPKEGMMVYDEEADCLKINTDGSASGWKCFNVQTCPD